MNSVTDIACRTALGASVTALLLSLLACAAQPTETQALSVLSPAEIATIAKDAEQIQIQEVLPAWDRRNCRTPGSTESIRPCTPENSSVRRRDPL